MPSKNIAQREKMRQLHKEGKITDRQWGHWKKLKTGVKPKEKNREKN